MTLSLANAFGVGVPRRDLALSPDHAAFVDGVLIPIKHLINHATVVQVARDNKEYWHVELERHDIILAEGLPTDDRDRCPLDRRWRSGKNKWIESFCCTFQK